MMEYLPSLNLGTYSYRLLQKNQLRQQHLIRRIVSRIGAQVEEEGALLFVALASVGGPC